MRRFHALTIIATALAANATFAQDKGNLNIYCSMQIEWCKCEVNLSVLLVPSPLFLTPNSPNAAR